MTPAAVALLFLAIKALPLLFGYLAARAATPRARLGLILVALVLALATRPQGPLLAALGFLLGAASGRGPGASKGRRRGR